MSSADLIHFDVMDGHFVPNISFGADFLRAVKASTDLPVDDIWPAGLDLYRWSPTPTRPLRSSSTPEQTP